LTLVDESGFGTRRVIGDVTVAPVRCVNSTSAWLPVKVTVYGPPSAPATVISVVW